MLSSFKKTVYFSAYCSCIRSSSNKVHERIIDLLAFILMLVIFAILINIANLIHDFYLIKFTIGKNVTTYFIVLLVALVSRYLVKINFDIDYKKNLQKEKKLIDKAIIYLMLLIAAVAFIISLVLYDN